MDFFGPLDSTKNHLILDATNNYDVVFLCGDLNFRLDKSREDVIDIVAKLFSDRSQNNVGLSLLESDQLKNSIKQSKRKEKRPR